MNNLAQITRRSLVAALAVASSLLLVLVSAQAFASPAMTSSLSVSTVVAGNKVDLTTQIPAVSTLGQSTQEIIQNIDATKVRLTGPTDVKAPAGWTLTYSTDGTNFVATPTNWAQVVKVKAVGSLNSGGVSGDGRQLISTTSTSAGTVGTVNGAFRSGGDGFATAFDSRGYMFNTYHRGLVNSSIDCRNVEDGSFCSPAWPFNMATHGFGSNIASTQFFDEVNKHIWVGNADSAQGTGFVCVDVSDIKVPTLCGGSKATAFKLVQARTGAASTSVFNIIAAEGKIYSWDITVPRLLCLDYLANDGLGAVCNSPTLTGLAGTAPTNIANAWPNITTNLDVAFGNVYGQYGSFAICFNAKTQALCPGWTGVNQQLGSIASNVAMYLQPDAAGQVNGVCFTNDNKCFAADGTRFNGNNTVQAAITTINPGRFQNFTETVGTKLIIANAFNSNSSLYCYDYATSSACANWQASTLVSGMGQLRMNVPQELKVYTIESDYRNSDCIWTNGDAGILAPISISTGTFGCQIKMAAATFKQADISRNLACDGTSGTGYDRFTLGGLVRGTDYTSASLTITKANGSVLESGGTTWSGVAFNTEDYVDLRSVTPADLGSGAVFTVNFVGKDNNKASTGTLLMQSTSAQLCLSLTVNVICPTTTIVGTPETTFASFTASGSSTSATSQVTNYSVTSSDLTVAPPATSACGFKMLGVVGQGKAYTAFPSTLIPIPGIPATLLDGSGNVLNDANGNPIVATSDAAGTLDFGYIKAGTYKLRFADIPLVNGVGPGDVAMVFRAPYTYAGGGVFVATPQNPVNFTTIQTPLDSPAVTGTAGGADVTVKASYTMRAFATADTASVKSGAATTIDIVANDKPTTGESFNNNSLKICATGTTTNCALNTLTVTGQGTYAVSSGKINFTPVVGFSGEATPITYQIADGFSNTPQTVRSTLNVTVVPAPVAVADTLTGNTLAPITVDVTTNDTAASGATIDKSSVKLCASGTTTGCALTSVTLASHGTYAVNNLGVVTFTPNAGFVGAVPAITYSINDSVGSTATATVTATVTNTPPRLNTPDFESAKLNVETTYVQTLLQGSGVIPATGAWSITGAVPPGMSFNVNTGAISGTPNTSGTYQFTVQVTDANNLVSSKIESITVATPPSITTTPLTYKLYVNTEASLPASAVAGTGSIPATGSWSATGLPTGLSINTANGTISGTPSVTGTFQVIQKVTDEYRLFDEETLSIKVVRKPVITTAALPSLEANKVVPAIEQAITIGSAALPATGAWSIVSGELPAGLSFNLDTGAITGTPTSIGTFTFTVKLTDVDGEVSEQVQTLRVNNPPVITTTPLSYKLYKDEAASLPNTVTAGTGNIPVIGAWTATSLPQGLVINGSTGAITGTPTSTGTFQVKVKVTDSNDLFDEETLSVVVVAKPVITTPVLPAVEINKEITPIAQTRTVGSALLPATGAWSIIAGTLPQGLSFNLDTGAITGTPTVSGSFPITVKLTDVDGEFSTKVETIIVNTPPVITTNPLTYKLYRGEPATLPSTATAGTGVIPAIGAWSATGMPSGLSISPSTGEISGTPTVNGTFQVVQRVTDMNSLFDTETLTIRVVSKPLITTALPLRALVLGTLANPILQTSSAGSAAIGSTGAWSVLAGTLPAGLTMNPDTGAISGTPTASGSFQITVKLVDVDGEFSTMMQTVVVNTPPTITTTPLTRSVNVNVQGSVPNTATPGTGAIRVNTGWSATGLPAGMTINGDTGEISGVPTAVGSYPVNLTVTDVNGLTDTEVLTINVVNGPQITTTPTAYKFGVNNDLNFMADDFFAQQFPISKSRIINNTATPGSFPIKTTGGWSATGLPAGLVINADNGKISGTATTVGEYPVNVTVTDTAGNTSSRVLNISIVQGPKNTTQRVWNYELDIKKRIGMEPESITQTYTLGSAPLSDGRPVPFLTQGKEPDPVTGVSIVDGSIQVLPYLFQSPGKEKYGAYTLKTLIVDKNGAYDLATFTINIVKPGSNITALPMPVGITDGMKMTTSTYPLAGTSSAKLPVTYTSETPKVCTVDSAKKTMKMVNEGTCTITASSGTGAKLSKATQSFSITKLPQTVSIVTPGQLIPGGLLTAPMPTDDPNGFKLHASASSGLPPVYETLDPNICSVDANGIVTWDADLTVVPRVESDFKCRVKVSQPGDTTYSAAPAQTITLTATHVEPPAPEDGIAKEPTQSASLPATGGTTPMIGGNSFKVIVDNKKKTVTVQPVSKGRWIGPIYADIKITYTPKGTTTPQVQMCKRNFFGIAVLDSKKAMVTPPLGGDHLVIPENAKHKKSVDALIKKYQAMTNKFSTTKTVKGKKVTTPGYLDWKPLVGQATCVLDSKAYAAWKSGVPIEATATVTRDRRWPTTYTKYKSYDWKKKSNNGIIYPTVVEWVIKIG
jgi:CshA-type fibril repeat protein